MNDAIERPAQPQIVLGCGSMAAEDARGAFAVLDAFAASGGRALDTARIYGSSEEVVGSWLEARDALAEVFLETKGAHPSIDDWSPRLDRQAVLDDLQISLRSLRVSSVDCFVLHRDHEAIAVTEVAGTLTDLVALGHAATIGVSNWSSERVAGLIAALDTIGGPPLSVVSNYGGFAVPTAAAEWPGVRSTTPQLLSLAHAEGFRVFGWSSLSSGFFTDDRPHREFGGEQNRRLRGALEDLARVAGVDPVAVLMRALATRDPLFVPVVSTQNPDRIRMLCAAAQDSALDEPAAGFLGAIAATELRVPHW